MLNAFNKCILLCLFQKSDLVLAVQSPIIISKQKGKLERYWEGSFMVEKVFSEGAYLLITKEGNRTIRSNAHFLRKCYT